MPNLTSAGPARPRILILAYQIVPHDARFLKLKASLEAAGFDVGSVAPGLPGRKAHPDVVLAEARQRPEYATGAWLWSRLIANRLIAIGERFLPDIIYTFDPEALPVGVRLKERTGAALVYDAHEFHEDEDPSDPARGAWVKRAELKAANSIDVFVTVNRSIADLYRSERPCFPAALVVHNAVDPYPAASYDGRLHAAANLTCEARILLYQGGLSRMRGLDRLVAAAPFLSPDWHIVMMGDGPLLEVLRASADNKLVRFIPPAPYAELPAWTRGASLGALLYDDTGRNQHYCSPNKLWEYAAAGVPTVASDLPEIRRVVVGGGTGVLIPPDALPDAIAKTVNSLGPDYLRSVSARAQHLMASESWSSEVLPLVQRLQPLRSSGKR